MPHRDPQTGQFVSDSGGYDDVEVVTFEQNVGIPAADLTGGTAFLGGDNGTFEGIELVDYDDIVDRNESLQLLEAQHLLTVYSNSTATADGTVRANVEVSSSPARSLTGLGGGADVPDSTGGVDDAGGGSDDSIDILGRYMVATAHAPHSDSAGGTGGGGSAGRDDVTVSNPPSVVGQFHPRDELFMNGTIEVWNIDDAGVHVDVSGQHVYGVVET